jgi:hypothetical protein
MGSIVVAEVGLLRECDSSGENNRTIATEIRRLCEKTLAQYKVPAIIRILPTLDLATSANCRVMHNAVVTGGSRGLGLAISQALLSAGYRVIAIARQNNDELAAPMARAESQYPGLMQFLPFDLGIRALYPSW